MNDNTSVIYPTAAWVRGAYIILGGAIVYGMVWSGQQARAAITAAWHPLHDAWRWLRGWWHSRHPLHHDKGSSAFDAADREVLASPQFRSAFATETVTWPATLDTSPYGPGGAPPWSPQPQPAETTGSMLPVGINPIPAASKPAPQAPAAVLPAEVTAILRHDDTDSALDSILQRALTPELLARLDAAKEAGQ